jgi:cAMP-dependent protein kinase regulator
MAETTRSLGEEWLVLAPSAEALGAVPLFASMPEHARQRLAGLLEIEHHGAGHVIVRQGQSGYAFYVVADGAVVVTQDDAVLRELGRGDYFGELAIVGDGGRTAAVTAATDVVLWALFGTHFRELQMSEPAVAAELQDAVTQRWAHE